MGAVEVDAVHVDASAVFAGVFLNLAPVRRAADGADLIADLVGRTDAGDQAVQPGAQDEHGHEDRALQLVPVKVEA